jgi:CheY-like chemotaxis protein
MSLYGNVVDKPSPPRGDGQEVLVVAGDPLDSELVSTTLELAGYRVGTAGSGAEGMVRLSRQRFDLVVWDATLRENAYLAWGRRVAPADRPPLLFLATCDSLPGLVPELGREQEDYVTWSLARRLRCSRWGGVVIWASDAERRRILFPGRGAPLRLARQAGVQANMCARVRRWGWSWRERGVGVRISYVWSFGRARVAGTWTGVRVWRKQQGPTERGMPGTPSGFACRPPPAHC